MGGGPRRPLLAAEAYEALLRRRALGASTEELRVAFGLRTRKQVRDIIHHRKERLREICIGMGIAPPVSGGARRRRGAGKNALWSPDALAFLKAHYPTAMALNAIARATRHHVYEVKRMAAVLGLARPDTAPPLKAKSALLPPADPEGEPLIEADLEDVLRWLAANGYRVRDGARAGTYRVGFTDAMTPQEVVRFANDRRARRRDGALPPFVVHAGVGVPLPAGPGGQSLTGSSMEAS